LNPDTSASRLPAVKHRAFTSLSNADFRIYFFAATAAMTADNIEHVISYWVMFQKFHSPALGGLCVGLLGSVVGNSLSYSAAALFLLYAAIFATRYVRRRQGM
jgi:hypothetical protein